MPFESVHITAPARLHLGFLDMHGGHDRQFGSLGLSLFDINTSLTASHADDTHVIGESAERATIYAEQVLSHFGINSGINITIKSAIPEHVGLGSGTQLALAVATAIVKLYALPEQSPAYLANLLHRGTRSGIGIGTFMHGGFIVDGGRGNNTQVPPTLSHIPFPEHWRILLIFDNDKRGLNGKSERQAFNTLPPMSAEISAKLCRLTLMQVLPALQEQNYSYFAAAITDIQNIIGDYFTQAQGGRYTSPFMQKIMTMMQNWGSLGIGQSSWGPTGFAIFRDETTAFQALKKAKESWHTQENIHFMIDKASNNKAQINTTIMPLDTDIKSMN